MTTKTIIVTGASRGLGAATAQLLAQMGANVVLSARSEEALAEVEQKIRSAGGQVLVVPGDVSRPEACDRLVDQAVERFGGLDGLVNNAGVIEPIAPIAESDPEAWLYNLSVNLIAPLMLSRAALPHLRESRGRIINVSSGAAVNAKTGWGAYCAAKAALNQFNSVLAREESAITAIAVRPGIVDTEMQAVIRREGGEGMAPEEHAQFVGFHEQGALQPPEVPARSLAALALRAPQEWSGEFVNWSEERVLALVEQGA